MARPNMYSVKVKIIEQQNMQAIHRVRNEIKNNRIAKANQIRGLVAEYGLVAPKELSSLRSAIPDWLEDASNGLTLIFRQLLQELYENLCSMDKRMAELDKQIIIVIAQHDPIAKRLQQLRGIGPLIATALVAAMGDAYLRCLLVHGTRSAMRTAKDKDDRLSRWITNLQEIRHANVAACAMTNRSNRRG